jgi:excinuclease ABC subunit C
LTGKLGRKVELIVPKRGEKADLVDGALRNARESLARKMAETATQTKLLQGLMDAFDLPEPPQRIEVYDNSHIQGTNAVGGMIVSPPVQTADQRRSRSQSGHVAGSAFD